MSSSRSKKRVNLRDVARAANVSVATVSRALNTPELVQTDTRKRVEDVIAELGFHRSPAARAINSGRTRILGALIPTLENDIYAQTMDSIEKRLGDFGYSLVVATTEENPEIELRRAVELLDLGVEGFFLPGVSHSDALLKLLELRHVSAIALSTYDPAFTYPTIGYDNAGAARGALMHLRGLGHHRIAVVHSPEKHNDRTRDRLAGLRGAQKDLKLCFHETDLSAAGGAYAVQRVFEEYADVDAFLCISDVMAFGVIYELHRRRVRIPEEVAVIGIHDLPLSDTIHPRLTSVRLPSRRMGSKAAEALAVWLDSGQRPDPICFDSQLIKRETT